MSLSSSENLRLPDEIKELLLRVCSPPSSVETAVSERVRSWILYAVSVAAYAERVRSVVSGAAAATAREGGVPCLGVMGGVGSSKVEAETKAEAKVEAKAEAKVEVEAKAKVEAEAEA